MKNVIITLMMHRTKDKLGPVPLPEMGLKRIADRFGLKFIAAVISIACISHAQPSSVINTTLENPVSAGSRSLIDLDAGRVYTFGESNKETFIESRRWRRETGADLMCETRPPAEGLAAYDMILIETDMRIDGNADYAAIKQRLDAARPQPFDLVAIGSSLPKRFLFRTREGAIGLLEIQNRTESPDGVRIRYRIVHPPPPPVLMADFTLSPREQQIQMQRQEIQQLRQRYLRMHPLVIEAQHRLEMLEQMARVEAAEKDPTIASLKSDLTRFEFELEFAAKSRAEKSPEIIALRRQLRSLRDQINEARKAARKVATTQPETFR